MFALAGSITTIQGLRSEPVEAAVRADLSGTLEGGEAPSSFDMGGNGWGVEGTVDARSIRTAAESDPYDLYQVSLKAGQRLDAILLAKAHAGVRIVLIRPTGQDVRRVVASAKSTGRPAAPIVASSGSARKTLTVGFDTYSALDYTARSSGVYVIAVFGTGGARAASAYGLNWTVDSDPEPTHATLPGESRQSPILGVISGTADPLDRYAIVVQKGQAVSAWLAIGSEELEARVDYADGRRFGPGESGWPTTMATSTAEYSVSVRYEGQPRDFAGAYLLSWVVGKPCEVVFSRRLGGGGSYAAEGRVTDAAGVGLSDRDVFLGVTDTEGRWAPLRVTRTGSDGSFSVQVSSVEALADARDYDVREISVWSPAKDGFVPCTASIEVTE